MSIQQTSKSEFTIAKAMPIYSSLKLSVPLCL